MKPEKKNQHQNTIITQPLTSRDAAPENHQVRPESLETFQPSNASSTEKNENDAIANSDFRLLKQAVHF